MTINVWENMTTAVTNTGDAGMTATAMREAGEFMSHHGLSMHRRMLSMRRRHLRVSVYFSHTFLFIAKGKTML